jgi:phycocyanobilin:ferredoxin oxidoreductase
VSDVWNTLIDIQHLLEEKFDATGKEIEEPGMDRFNQPGWINRVWTSNAYRRAHIDVVDCRESRGLWMMHCCIFPHLHNPAPIYGFDVVAGKNKITGCFHDFSSAGDKNHKLVKWFQNYTKDLQWKKTRQLPDWAERIFSPGMIAASNVQSSEELEQISNIVTATTNHYLNFVAETNDLMEETIIFQNYYAENQKQNPHTPRVMASLGLNEDDVKVFIEQCLFPDLRSN